MQNLDIVSGNTDKPGSREKEKNNDITRSVGVDNDKDGDNGATKAVIAAV